MKKNIGILAVGLAALSLASCGNGQTKTEAKGLKPADTTKMTVVDGHKPDAQVMLARRISGTWTGKSRDREIEASFGNTGEFSVRMMAKGAMVDAASGTYAWTPDGRLTGTTTGGMKDLATYSTWSGSFPDPSTLSITGADGADGAEMTVVNPHGLLEGVAKDPKAVAAAAAANRQGPSK